MNRESSAEAEYGNWVSKRIIFGPAIVGLLLLALSVFVPLLLIIAVPSLLLAGYFLYARYLFSVRGADVQSKIWATLLSYLDWDGKGQLLDIGCGNAALTIRAAKEYPQAAVTGIDFWGQAWEYSKSLCEKNAAREGVGDQVRFQQANASALPFEDEYFDAVVSNLTFHEVADAKDKRDVVREALRVLKKGGKFAFQDLFLIKQVYGEPDDLIGRIQGWGICKACFVDTSRSAFIPAALKLPFMVGTIALIHGQK